MKLYIDQQYSNFKEILATKGQSLCRAEELHVKDEEGNLQYRIVKEYLSFPHRIRVFDSENRIILFLQGKNTGFASSLEIFQNEEKVGEISPKFSLLSKKYQVSGFPYSVKSVPPGITFGIFRNDNMVATITKDTSIREDHYEVDYFFEEDIEMILITATVFDIDYSGRRIRK